MLGLLSNASCSSALLQLRPHDTVVICSDGVTEAVNTGGEEFGRQRLLETISAHRSASVDTMVDGLLLAVRRFSQGTPQTNDITVLVVSYRAPKPPSC